MNKGMGEIRKRKRSGNSSTPTTPVPTPISTSALDKFSESSDPQRPNAIAMPDGVW